MIGHHEQLRVWRRSHELTLEVYAATKNFPKEETYGLRAQMRRAALGVATNLSEGAARKSRREFAHFVSISRGSASEVAYLLLVSKDLGLLDHKRYEALNDGYNHVARMLTRMLHALSPHPQEDSRTL